MTPPAHIRLRNGDWPFWLGILRSRDEWGEADLPVVAQLARAMADAEAEARKLQREGMVVLNAAGKPVRNVRFERVDQLIKLEMALMRTLGIGGRYAGDARDQRGRRAAQRQAERVQAELESEELLARL